MKTMIVLMIGLLLLGACTSVQESRTKIFTFPDSGDGIKNLLTCEELGEEYMQENKDYVFRFSNIACTTNTTCVCWG